MSFSPYIAKRLAVLSTDLQGEVDGHESGLSGDHGLQKGKLLPKPKARMDAYRVGREVFSFVASSLDAPLRVRELKRQDSLNVPLATIQRLEQDSRITTMIGSFLDCSGTTSTLLLEEAMLEEDAS